MRQVVLIRHALPAAVAGSPAHRWGLSLEGRRRCGLLAELVRPCELQAVVSSLEPASQQTARLLAAELRVPVGTAAGLQESQVDAALDWDDPARRDDLQAFFEQPGELRLGQETASAALQRFGAAMRETLVRYPTGNLGLVSGGRVISLLLATFTNRPAWELWQALDQPAFAVMLVPPGKVAFLAETVTVLDRPTAATAD
ncbi:MAG: histidine phosphatase family protein [Fimbriimonadaceae bacterium]|nr:histidine phosphatase family protein [Fimbriimonadaceae bacterium]